MEPNTKTGFEIFDTISDLVDVDASDLEIAIAIQEIRNRKKWYQFWK